MMDRFDIYNKLVEYSMNLGYSRREANIFAVGATDAYFYTQAMNCYTVSEDDKKLIKDGGFTDEA